MRIRFYTKVILITVTVVFSYGSQAGLRESSKDQKPCAFKVPSSIQRTLWLQSSRESRQTDIHQEREILLHIHRHQKREILPRHLKNIKALSKKLPVSTSETEESSCPEFHNLEGENLVQAVLEAEHNCIVSDVFYAPEEPEHLVSLFKESKMIALIRKFKELADIYRGNNEDKISNFITYIWGGYYNLSFHYYTLSENFTENMIQELHLGLSAFISNPHFTNTNEEHLHALDNFVGLLTSSQTAVPYIDQLTDFFLNRFSLDYSSDLRFIIIRFLDMYRLSHIVEDTNNLKFRDYVLQGNTEPLEALIRFSKREELLNEENGYKSKILVFNAVENIGHFLQYGDYPLVYNLALSALEEILDTYSMESAGGLLSFIASASIEYWGYFSRSQLKPSCRTSSYDICSYAEEWHDFLFRPEYTHTCQATDQIKIKFMRDVPMAQRESACEDLIEIDNSFHEKLRTNRLIVPNDKNTTLEAIIFSSVDNYDIYGGPLFDIDTNNGGLYLEGSPEERGNIPRFFAYEDGGEDDLSIWNFKHEFVHYLDGRYIKDGGYGESSATGFATWWVEGLAEYIAKGTVPPSRTFYSLQKKTYQLSELFPDEWNVARVYHYGYAATRFLVEEFFHIAEELIQTMRNGWGDYVDRVEAIGTSLDTNFSSWLDEHLVTWAEELGEEEPGGDDRYGRINAAGEYCYAEPRSGQYAYITQISLADWQGIGLQGHDIYSLVNEESPIVLHSGSSYNFNITLGTTTTVFDDINLVEAWVDWNDDKVFSDTEKEVDTQVILSKTDIFQTVSQNLEVPQGARGQKRMRVRVSYAEYPFPDVCSSFESGEVEDYILSVLSSFGMRVNNIQGEVNSFLKVGQVSKTIPLSEIFSTHDNRTLNFSARSLDPQKVEVSIENSILTLRKVSAQERTPPIGIVITAVDSAGRQAVKEFSVVFEPYTLPLVLSASDERRESFVRIINNSNQNGVVRITGRDDSGEVIGPVSLSLSAGGSAHFNSGDLENGNKGLTGSLGSGEGDWRLTLISDLDFHASSYIRLKGEGFVTSMTEPIALETNDSNSYNYFVPIFNPASNQNQNSLLKLFNPNTSSALINITGVDDLGYYHQNVQLTLSPKGSKTITSRDLEEGAEGLDGYFGDGQGKWRLEISSSHSIDIINLMESPTGHLSNLSLSSDRFQKILLPAQANRHGFIRIINHSNQEGEVTITASDDSSRIYAPIQLSISALEAIHFNSYDLQNGNEDKGFPVRGLGVPQGMWKLKFESDLDISVLSYMRSSDGFLTSLDRILPVYGNNQYSAQFFNPASNQNQKSYLRFTNTHNETVWVRIQGFDDRGVSSGAVSFNLPAGSTKELSSLDLETGRAEGLRGSLGDGSGKWRLNITTGKPLLIMNLLESPNGYISNLSM